MDAAQASPVSAWMAVSREQNDHPLVPLRGRTPAATEMSFGSGGIAVAGVGEQAVERALVGALDLDYLGAAGSPGDQCYRVAAYAECGGHGGQGCLGRPAAHGGRADPDDQRAVVFSADPGPCRAGPDP